MTCRDTRLAILEFLEGDLAADARRGFLRHLAGCADCSRYLESYRAAVALSRDAGASSEASEEMPEDLVRSILAAAPTPVRSIFSGRRAPSHLWNLAAGIAASQVLFFYFGS